MNLALTFYYVLYTNHFNYISIYKNACGQIHDKTKFQVKIVY